MACESILFCPQLVTLLIEHLRLAAGVAKGHGLSLSGYLVLSMRQADGCPLQVGDYAETLGMKPASIMKVLQDLEDRGLVVKESAAWDKRIVELKKTQAGLELMEAVTRDISSLFESLFWKNIPADELKRLRWGIPVFLESVGVDVRKIDDGPELGMSPQFLHSPYQTVRRWKAALSGEPVTFAEYRVLSLLRAQRGVVPSNASNQLCMRRSQVSPILKSLIEKGLAREASLYEEDGRSKRYVTTRKGSRLASRLDRKLERITEDAYAVTNGWEAHMLDAWHLRMYFDLIEFMRKERSDGA